MSTKTPVSIVPAIAMGIVFLLMWGILLLTNSAISNRVDSRAPALDTVQDGQLVATHIQVTEYCYEGVRYIAIRDGLSVKWNVTENRPYLCVSTDTGIIIK